MLAILESNTILIPGFLNNPFRIARAGFTILLYLLLATVFPAQAISQVSNISYFDGLVSPEINKSSSAATTGTAGTVLPESISLSSWDENAVIWDSKSKIFNGLKALQKKEEAFYLGKDKNPITLLKIWEELEKLHQAELIIRDKALTIAKQAGENAIYSEEQAFWENVYLNWEKEEQIIKKKNISETDIQGIYELRKPLWQEKNSIWNNGLAAAGKQKKYFEKSLTREYGKPFILQERSQRESFEKQDVSYIARQLLLKEKKQKEIVPAASADNRQETPVNYLQATPQKIPVEAKPSQTPVAFSAQKPEPASKSVLTANENPIIEAPKIENSIPEILPAETTEGIVEQSVEIRENEPVVLKELPQKNIEKQPDAEQGKTSELFPQTQRQDESVQNRRLTNRKNTSSSIESLKNTRILVPAVSTKKTKVQKAVKTISGTASEEGGIPKDSEISDLKNPALEEKRSGKRRGSRTEKEQLNLKEADKQEAVPLKARQHKNKPGTITAYDALSESVPDTNMENNPDKAELPAKGRNNPVKNETYETLASDKATAELEALKMQLIDLQTEFKKEKDEQDILQKAIKKKAVIIDEPVVATDEYLTNKEDTKILSKTSSVETGNALENPGIKRLPPRRIQVRKPSENKKQVHKAAASYEISSQQQQTPGLKDSKEIQALNNEPLKISKKEFKILERREKEKQILLEKMEQHIEKDKPENLTVSKKNEPLLMETLKQQSEKESSDVKTLQQKIVMHEQSNIQDTSKLKEELAQKALLEEKIKKADEQKQLQEQKKIAKLETSKIQQQQAMHVEKGLGKQTAATQPQRLSRKRARREAPEQASEAKPLPKNKKQEKLKKEIVSQLEIQKQEAVIKDRLEEENKAKQEAETQKLLEAKNIQEQKKASLEKEKQARQEAENRRNLELQKQSAIETAKQQELQNRQAQALQSKISAENRLKAELARKALLEEKIKKVEEEKQLKEHEKLAKLEISSIQKQKRNEPKRQAVSAKPEKSLRPRTRVRIESPEKNTEGSKTAAAEQNKQLLLQKRREEKQAQIDLAAKEKHENRQKIEAEALASQKQQAELKAGIEEVNKAKEEAGTQKLLEAKNIQEQKKASLEKEKQVRQEAENNRNLELQIKSALEAEKQQELQDNQAQKLQAEISAENRLKAELVRKTQFEQERKKSEEEERLKEQHTQQLAEQSLIQEASKKAEFEKERLQLEEENKKHEQILTAKMESAKQNSIRQQQIEAYKLKERERIERQNDENRLIQNEQLEKPVQAETEYKPGQLQSSENKSEIEEAVIAQKEAEKQKLLILQQQRAQEQAEHERIKAEKKASLESEKQAQFEQVKKIAQQKQLSREEERQTRITALKFKKAEENKRKEEKEASLPIQQGRTKQQNVVNGTIEQPEKVLFEVRNKPEAESISRRHRESSRQKETIKAEEPANETTVKKTIELQNRAKLEKISQETANEKLAEKDNLQLKLGLYKQQEKAKTEAAENHKLLILQQQAEQARIEAETDKEKTIQAEEQNAIRQQEIELYKQKELRKIIRQNEEKSQKHEQLVLKQAEQEQRIEKQKPEIIQTAKSETSDIVNNEPFAQEPVNTQDEPLIKINEEYKHKSSRNINHKQLKKMPAIIDEAANKRKNELTEAEIKKASMEAYKQKERDVKKPTSAQLALKARLEETKKKDEEEKRAQQQKRFASLEALKLQKRQAELANQQKDYELYKQINQQQSINKQKNIEPVLKILPKEKPLKSDYGKNNGAESGISMQEAVKIKQAEEIKKRNEAQKQLALRLQLRAIENAKLEKAKKERAAAVNKAQMEALRKQLEIRRLSEKQKSSTTSIPAPAVDKQKKQLETNIDNKQALKNKAKIPDETAFKKAFKAKFRKEKYLNKQAEMKLEKQKAKETRLALLKKKAEDMKRKTEATKAKNAQLLAKMVTDKNSREKENAIRIERIERLKQAKLKAAQESRIREEAKRASIEKKQQDIDKQIQLQKTADEKKESEIKKKREMQRASEETLQNKKDEARAAAEKKRELSEQNILSANLEKINKIVAANKAKAALRQAEAAKEQGIKQKQLQKQFMSGSQEEPSASKKKQLEKSLKQEEIKRKAIEERESNKTEKANALLEKQKEKIQSNYDIYKERRVQREQAKQGLLLKRRNDRSAFEKQRELHLLRARETLMMENDKQRELARINTIKSREQREAEGKIFMETLKNRRAQKSAMEKKEYENSLIKNTIVKKNELQAILADKTEKLSIIEAKIKELQKQKTTKQSDKIKNADTLITLKKIAKALRADVLKAEDDLKNLNLNSNGSNRKR